MRISDYDRVLSPGEGDLFVMETLEGTKTIAYEDLKKDITPLDIVLSDNDEYGYVNTNDQFVPFKSQADIDAAVAAAMVGTATAADVLSGKTFTNSSTSGVNGEMVNNGAVSPSGLNCGGSYTIPAGYHNGSGKVTANSLKSQTGVDSGKTAVTAGTMVSGYQGWVNGSKISGTFAGQTKSVTATTSSQDVTPDSGKYLTKVTVSPQTHSDTYKPTANSSASNMGKNHNYRYVDTRTVYNLGMSNANIMATTLSHVKSVNPYSTGYTGLTVGYYYIFGVSYWTASNADNSTMAPTVSSGGTLLASSYIAGVAASGTTLTRVHVMAVVKATATTVKLNLKNAHASSTASWWSAIRIYPST